MILKSIFTGTLKTQFFRFSGFRFLLLFIAISKHYNPVARRVGRTARGEGGQGHALMILRPEELGFLRYLKQANVPLNEFEFSWNKVANIQVGIGIWRDNLRASFKILYAVVQVHFCSRLSWRN